MLALLASTIALVLTSGTPAFAGINPNTTYEYDCTTALQPGVAAPFAVTANLNGAPDPSFPSGALFHASGAISVTLVGGFIAGLGGNGVITPNGSFSSTITGLTVAPTDSTASGSYSYTKTFGSQTATENDLAGVSWAQANNTATTGTLLGNFAAGDIGKGVSGPTGGGLPTGATIVAVNPGVSATISPGPVTADHAATTVGLWSAVTFTDATVNTGNVFTTSTVHGSQSNVGLTTLTGGLSVNGNLTVPFGSGGAGVGANNCLETGYDASENPGPGQTPNTAPAFPPPSLGGPGTPLVAASGGNLSQPGTAVQITPPTAAFVAAVDPSPVDTNQLFNLGVGGSKDVALNTSDSDATPPTSCSLVGSPSDARLAVTIDNTPSLCTAHLTDSGSGPATVTFQWNASDGVTTGNTATATVSIGTPPVDQKIDQQVNAGQLVLSCNDPTVYLPGSALTTCPLLTLPPITLDGLQQTVSAPANAIFVSDNRGDPAVGWDLTTYMVVTPSNPNASCATATDFCNSSVGTHALNNNGHIRSGNLSLSGVSCGVFTGNLNAAPTADPGTNFGASQGLCHAAAGVSGGTFAFNGQFNLAIPSSVYAGLYMGTVEYLVS